MQAMASSVHRLERELYAAATARKRDSARYAAMLERAVRAWSTEPVAGELFDLADVYVELASEYQTLGRYEDALAAADAAVDAELKDPRCLRAQILMRAGRVAEAEPIWVAVRADTPQDVRLYNNAGFEYADAGDHDAALDWLTEGLRLALRTGDPERLVDQLADLRQNSLDSLGRPADALQEQATAFLLDKEHASSVRAVGPEQHSSIGTDDGPVNTVGVAWPPGRNQPCWCGSGRKYKKCCAATNFDDVAAPQ
jgi:tetratricopeptide (TPR) repeat protein